MIITEFDREDVVLRDELADLLRKTWPQSYGDRPDEEVVRMMAPERIAVAALDGEDLIGFIGAIPQYGVTGWEMHLLVVRDNFRRQHIGSRLVDFLEREVASRGGLTLYLGTDDEKHETSLSDGDIFEDPLGALARIQNYKDHPYAFYQRKGYQLVGVIPDANGWQKPDIWMAKRVTSKFE